MPGPSSKKQSQRTKGNLRGLQEFSELCKQKSEDSLKAVLPFWPRTYNKMALDVDHRVRETAQQAMSTLAGKVRRNLAPYLKGLMGPWLMSQSDTYPTVASAAQQSFQAAFPPAKQTDAFSFCKLDILTYMTENLTTHTLHTLSDPKTTEPEDMESKYNRVLTSSLLAVRKLLLALPADQMDSIREPLTTLLENPKLWKHGKSKIKMVKGAFYAFLAALCQCQTELSTLYVSKMAPLILHSLDEVDPAICSYLWEAVLSLVNYIPDAWKHVNVQKASWPKLKAILENGCHGNAVVIGPNLLPLISRLPEDLFPDNNRFYNDFFTNFKLGLSLASVQKSPSECSALVKAFVECVQYVTKQKAADPLAETILIDQLLPLVEASFVETAPSLYKSPLYGMLGTILTAVEQTEKAVSQDAARKFWELMAEHIEDRMVEFDKNSEGESSFDERLLHLVKCLFYPQTVLKQKPVKVKVSFDTSDTSISTALSDLTVTEQKSDLCEGGKQFVRKLTVQAFKHAHKHWSTEHLRIFSKLIELDSSEETVAMVIQCCESDAPSDISSSSYFVFDICLPWLKNLQDKRDSDKDFTHLINVICVFIPILDDASVRSLLERLTQDLTHLEALHILLLKLFSLNNTNGTVQQWIGSDKMAEKMVSIATIVCDRSLQSSVSDDDELEHGWAILTKVLSTEENGEPVVTTAAIQGILTTVQQSLLKLDLSQADDRADRAVSFVAKAAQSFFCGFRSCLLMTSAVDLLVTLFNLTLGSHQQVQESTLQTARLAWSSGIQATVQQTGGLLSDSGILTQVTARVRDAVRELTSLPRLLSLMESVQLLVSAVQGGLPEATDEVNPVLQTFAQQLLVNESYSVPTQTWDYLCVDGRYPKIPGVKSGASSIFPTATLFTSLYNCRLLHLIHGSDKVEQTDSETGSSEIDWFPDRLAILLNSVQGYSIVQHFMEANTVVFSIPAIRDDVEQLSSEVKSLLNSLTTTQAKQLWEMAFQRCETDAHCVLCLKFLLSQLSEQSPGTIPVTLDSILDRCGSLSESTVYLLYSVVEHMAENDQLSLTEILVARILSIQDSEDFSSQRDVTFLLSALMTLLPLVTTSNLSEVLELMTAVLDQILTWKEQKDDLLLYSCDMSEVSGRDMVFNAEVCRFLQQVIRYMSSPGALHDKHWDFISCSLVSWIQSLEESQGSLLTSVSVQCLSVSVCALLAEMSTCMTQIAKSAPDSKLLTEWDEFFSDSAFSVLLPLFLKLYKLIKDGSRTGTDRLVMTALGQAVSKVPQQKVLQHTLPPYLVAGDTSPLPDNLQTLMNHVGPMLMSSERAVQVAAFHVLDRVMPELPQYDKEDKSMIEGDAAAAKEEETSTRSPPSRLMQVIEDSGVGMEALLADVHVEECLPINPHSQEYHYALAYLLSWKLVLQFFRSAPAQLRQEYAGYFQEHGSVARLMHHIFCLMPGHPSKMFETEPAMEAAARSSEMEVQHLACSLYVSLLKTMPAMVRQWWKEQDRRTSAYIDKYTTKNVSHHLCRAEIQTVQETDVQLDYITIKARASTREVIATYALEEVSIEIVIALPQNYPLGNISVQSEKRVGVSGPQWEKWLLQLSIFLQHQNGNIIEGLRLWKNNIDKRFEGVDDCMICFSVLHGTNFQLPRITCRTCKKKFHSACLYKWFNTSHNCTCPLCRNVF